MVECSPPPKRPAPTPVRDLFVCPFVVTVDTREQAPWTFQGIVIEKRVWVVLRGGLTLATGDYSIVGYESQLCIERKSAADLVGSISSGNARFRREHERMHEIVQTGGFACVVVEGSLSTICEELDGDDSRRNTSNMVIGATASWPMRFGVPWFYAGDRRHAELLAFRIMLKWWKQREELCPNK